MNKYIYIPAPQQRANAVTLKGEYLSVREVSAETKVNMPHIEAATMAAALVMLKAKAYEQPVVAPILKSITKRQLVDDLIELGVAEQFHALLNSSIPLAEKLRWEASATIAPDYSFITENRTMILTVLGITGEQFDGIFR